MKVLCFAGSARRGSVNKRLVNVATTLLEAEGAEVIQIDLNDFPLPLYNGDLEEQEGLPENVLKLKELMIGSDAFLIASPEYNGSISPLLKNTIDWCSRPGSKDEPGLVAYKDKVAALISASPGGLGGLRGLSHLRTILTNIGVLVIPEQAAVSNAYSVFDDEGNIIDDVQKKRLCSIVSALYQTGHRLVGGE